jgi:hypothetical protein
MWTADDFITVDASGKERPWQNLILVTGNDTVFAQLSADVLHRTGQNIPMLWFWEGWRTDTKCWTVGRIQHCSQGQWPCTGGSVPPPPGAPAGCTACLRHCGGSPNATLARFGDRYNVLRAQYPHLPPKPWGVYFGDEQDLARHPDRQTMLAKGLQLVKQQYPEAITYINMLYNSVGCPGPNPGGPFLCNSSTWRGDPTALAVALGKMQLDWMSTDQYHNVPMQHYQAVYKQRLYPHLRPDQRIILLPYAAFCESGCETNITIAGPDPATRRNCSDTPWGECWTGCPPPTTTTGPPWPCAGGNVPPPAGAAASCNACPCNVQKASCRTGWPCTSTAGVKQASCSADSHSLENGQAHLKWAMTDARVIGLFVYRLKNIWQTTDMSQLDACQNPWGTGLGLVDRCGVGGVGGYATPKTLTLYRQNISRALTGIKTDDESRFLL